MAQAIKSLVLSGVMGTVAHAGGRKSDKYFIFLAGASYAGISLVIAGMEFADKVANSPVTKGIAKLVEILTGLGGFALLG